jgi:hypothetical protein
MTLTELNPTQRSVLIAIDHKEMTVMATGKLLKIDRALASNLLNQLVELGYAKKYENGQFISSPVGKLYLKNKLAEAPKKAVPQQSSKPSTAVQVIDVDTNTELKPGDDLYKMLSAAPAENLSENIGELLAMAPAESPKPNSIAVLAQAEATAIVTQLQPSKPGLPVDIEKSLLNLEKLLHVPVIKPLPDIDTKLQVLERLAALLHPTIADVLDAIADDLQRVQQVAVDVSKAA